MSTQPLPSRRLARAAASIAATVAHTLSTAYRDAWGLERRWTK